MESDVRVCPFCGDPPGVGMFCGVCGRNLAAVERLPTRAEWEIDRPASAATTEDRGPVAERCAEATAAFLAAMHAAGDPGASKIAMSRGAGFRRARQTYGWVVRPVHREHDDDPSRYEPGLVVTTEGRFHRRESEVRGWGQRDFPRYHDTVDPDPIDMPVEERLIDELAAVLRENGVASDPPPTTPYTRRSSGGPAGGAARVACWGIAGGWGRCRGHRNMALAGRPAGHASGDPRKPRLTHNRLSAEPRSSAVVDSAERE